MQHAAYDDVRGDGHPLPTVDVPEQGRPVDEVASELGAPGKGTKWNERLEWLEARYGTDGAQAVLVAITGKNY